jgi:hypothetical protein
MVLLVIYRKGFRCQSLKLEGSCVSPDGQQVNLLQTRHGSCKLKRAKGDRSCRVITLPEFLDLRGLLSQE